MNSPISQLLVDGNLSKIIIVLMLLALSAFLISKTFSSFTKQKKIAKLGRKLPSSKPQYVRKSDLTKLSPEQASLNNQAQRLLEAGKAIDAAKLLEAANLHREAISILENSGHIDEACAILFRMQRPGRAGAVYSRNAMHAKAGDCYLLGNDNENAAKQYIEAGKEDSTYFEKAGRIYEASANIDLAIQAYMAGNYIDKIIQLSFREDKFVYLFNYMSQKSVAKEVFASLDSAKLSILVSKLPLNEKAIQILVLWTEIVKTVEFIALILKRLRQNNDALCFYWQLLPNSLCESAIDHITKYVNMDNKPTVDFVAQNGAALFKTGKFSFAARLYFHAQRHAMAAKCLAHAGDLSKCLEAIKLLNDSHLSQRCETAMQENAVLQQECYMAPGQWHPKIVEAMCRALEEIDPDNDAAALQSPFAMTG